MVYHALSTPSLTSTELLTDLSHTIGIFYIFCPLYELFINFVIFAILVIIRYMPFIFRQLILTISEYVSLEIPLELLIEILCMPLNLIAMLFKI